MVLSWMLAVLALAGCASTTGPVEYPKDWAPLDLSTTADGCPNISGTYSNHGSGTFPTMLGEPPNLNEVFARMGQGTGFTSPRASNRVWPVVTEATSMSLKLEPESLRVFFISETGEGTPLVFRRYHFKLFGERYDDLFTCYEAENGVRLRFFAEPESHSGVFLNIYVEGGGTVVFLLKATDGSLVIQWRSDSIAISPVILGSHARFNSVWWKYPPLNGTQ